MNEGLFLWAFGYKFHSKAEKKILTKKILKPDLTVSLSKNI